MIKCVTCKHTLKKNSQKPCNKCKHSNPSKNQNNNYEKESIDMKNNNTSKAEKVEEVEVLEQTKEEIGLEYMIENYNIMKESDIKIKDSCPLQVKVIEVQLKSIIIEEEVNNQKTGIWTEKIAIALITEDGKVINSLSTCIARYFKIQCMIAGKTNFSGMTCIRYKEAQEIKISATQKDRKNYYNVSTVKQGVILTSGTITKDFYIKPQAYVEHENLIDKANSALLEAPEIDMESDKK